MNRTPTAHEHDARWARWLSACVLALSLNASATRTWLSLRLRRGVRLVTSGDLPAGLWARRSGGAAADLEVG